MRDGPRSGAHRWAIGNWGLRWKVATLVALPLAAALALGGLRIANEMSDSDRFHDEAGDIQLLSPIDNLSTAMGVMASGQGSGTLAPADIDNADKAVNDLERVLSTHGISHGRATVDALISVSRSAVADARTGTATPASIHNDQGQIFTSSNSALNQILSPANDFGVNAQIGVLTDVMVAMNSMSNELLGVVNMTKRPHPALSDVTVPADVERSLLQVLGMHFPAGDPTMKALSDAIDARIAMVATALNSSNDNNTSTAGSYYGSSSSTSTVKDNKQLDATIMPFRASLVDSLGQYLKLRTGAVDRITSVVQQRYAENRSAAVRDSAAWIIGLIVELLLAALAARSLVLPLRRLRHAAEQVAETELPAEIDRLRDGEDIDDVVGTSMPVDTTEEVGQLARAIDNIHDQALLLAGEQAQLRLQVGDMFETLARRSKSLVDQQLGVIESMEYEEKDPTLLEGLFRLDHLAARMRRNSDNLLILAGTKARRTKAVPVEIGDVLRAAISEVEEYQRVKLGATPRGSLVEPAASDIAHVFAELLDNALRASPPETDVTFNFAPAGDQGLLVEVADQGIGIPPGDLVEINASLETEADISPDTARHMGLFVVSRLAERHGLTVRLRPTVDAARDSGVTVTVHVPPELIVGAGTPEENRPMMATQPHRPLDTSAEESMRDRSAPGTPGPMRAPNAAVPAPMHASSGAVSETPPEQERGVGAASGTPEIQEVTRTPAGNMMITVNTSNDLPILPQRRLGATSTPDPMPPLLQPPQQQVRPLDPMRDRSAPSLDQMRDRSAPSLGEPPAPPRPQPTVSQSNFPPAGRIGNGAGPGAGGSAVLPDLPKRQPGTSWNSPGSPQHRPSGQPDRSDRVPTQNSFGSLVGFTPPSGLTPRAEQPQHPAGQEAVRARADVEAAKRAQAAVAAARMAEEAEAAEAARRAWEEAGSPGAGPDSAYGRTPDSSKTASFFQSRMRPPSPEDTSGIPIFAEMMSGWLADWQHGMPRPNFESIADHGWEAAQRVAGAPAIGRTGSGLPQRQPGQRFIPGSVGSIENRMGQAVGAHSGYANGAPIDSPGARPDGPQRPADSGSGVRRRDPESVRASLASHQAGVRNGRAMSTMKATGDEGVQ